ncbi:MAG: MFS transporter [bacterium]
MNHRFPLAALSLSMTLSALGTSSANIALPTLARHFDATVPQVQWVVIAYLLAVTTLIVSAGRLGDQIGRRRLLLGGTALFTLASTLCGLAPTLELLIAGRAVQGLGAAAMMAMTMAVATDTVAAGQTGRVMGLMGTMSAIGTALGPSLGGALITIAGWQAIFLINLPLGLLALTLAARHLPVDPATNRHQDFDLAGTALLGLTLAAYAVSMTGGGRLTPVLLVATAAGAAGFVWLQNHVKTPLIPRGALQVPGMKPALLMNLLVSTVIMSTLVVGPFYLSLGLGLTAAQVGLIMSVGPVISALSGVVAGRLVDRLGSRPTLRLALFGMLIGTLALAILPMLSGAPGFIAAIALLTPGYQLFQAANNTAVMQGVPAERRGVTSGLLNLSRNLGLVTGASLMGAVFAAASTRSISIGTQTTFLLAAVLITLALLAALRPGA